MMVYQVSKATYRSSQGMLFDIIPTSIDEVVARMPESETSFPLVRKIEGHPEQSHYCAIAMPHCPPELTDVLKPKAYIVGLEQDGTLPRGYVKTADYAKGNNFGRIMIAHNILSATENESITEYDILTKDKVLKELLTALQVRMEKVGKMNKMEEKVVLNFEDPSERERIRNNANSWLDRFKA
jgi:hypothetical protein